MKKLRAVYGRWKHRRMIRRAWPIAYLEYGTLPRMMWEWRRHEKVHVSVSEAMKQFGRAVASAQARYGKVS